MGHNEEIDKLLASKGKPVVMGDEYKSKQLQQVISNIELSQKYTDKPITTQKYDTNVFGVQISLHQFLKARIWPRSIYTTDKLLRLTADAQIKFLERYLAKKRKMGFNFWWLIIIIFGVFGAVLVILFLLPMFGGLL